MKHYHGTPISGTTDVAKLALTGTRGLVSQLRKNQQNIIKEHCIGFVVDNGAFSAWKRGVSLDWNKYYAWVETLMPLPNFDFAIIPDIIDGTEADNDTLINQWPAHLKSKGAPVWHMHESLEKLKRLCNDWDVVCIGSSGEYVKLCTPHWWKRMYEAMDYICDVDGYPPCKLHGLRMMRKVIADKIPLYSADSTTLGYNVGIDKNSKIECRSERVLSIRSKIESIVAVDRFDRSVL